MAASLGAWHRVPSIDQSRALNLVCFEAKRTEAAFLLVPVSRFVDRSSAHKPGKQRLRLCFQSSNSGGSGRSRRSICSIDSLSSAGISRSTSTCSLSIKPGASSVCSEGGLRLFRGGDAVSDIFFPFEYRILPSTDWFCRRLLLCGNARDFSIRLRAGGSAKCKYSPSMRHQTS